MDETSYKEQAAKIRELNLTVLPAFYQNQAVMIGHLADLAYPFARFIDAERAEGLKAGFSGFGPEVFAAEALLSKKASGEWRRTGSVIAPVVTRLPLVYLAQLLARLDTTRRSVRAYKAARAEFVADVMQGFSYSLVMAVHQHVFAGPVKGCPIEPREQLDARRALTKLDAENEDFRLRLVNANEPLILKYGIPMMSLLGPQAEHREVMNLGRRGLLDAICKWEPGHGEKGKEGDEETGLAALAKHWIQHHIRREYQNTGFTVSRPVDVQTRFGKILKIQREHDGATPEFIAEELVLNARAKASPRLAAEISLKGRDSVLDRLREDEDWWKDYNKELRLVNDALSAPRVTSIDNSEQDEDGGYLNRQQFGVAEVVRASATVNEERAVMDRVLKRLPPAAETIVRLSFGLGEGKSHLRGALHAVVATSEKSTRTLLAERPNRPPAKIEILDSMSMED